MQGTDFGSDFVETQATARLPALNIEITHRRSPSGDAEHISINLQATPSFDDFGRFLEAANPFLFWARVVRMAWTPWLGSSPASIASRRRNRPQTTLENARLTFDSPGDSPGDSSGDRAS